MITFSPITATCVSCDTLRFHEKRGLIRATRGANGYRAYKPETAQLLTYIRTAQKLGFNLPEFGESLPALWTAEHPEHPYQAVAEVLMEKLKAIDQRIEDLQRLKAELQQRIVQICQLTAVK